jgi:hypothetical protein
VPILGGSLFNAMSSTRLLKHVMPPAYSPSLGRSVQPGVKPSAALCLVSRPELHIQTVDSLPNFPKVLFRGGKDFLGVEGASDAVFQQGESGLPFLVEGPPLPGMASPSLELDLVSEAEPIPLLCQPAAFSKVKKGSPKWTLHLVEEFNLFVGLTCDGFEEKLLTLFANIIASNTNEGEGCSSSTGKKGMRELNNFFCFINYDAHSGSASRNRNKGRVHKDF